MKTRLVQLAKLHNSINKEDERCGFSFNIHNIDVKYIPKEYYEHDGDICGRKTFRTRIKHHKQRGVIFSTEEK